MEHYEGVYKGSEGRLSRYDIRYKNEKSPLVLFCHGFKGFKDWGTFNLIAEYFVEAGFQCAKLNFSHNGTSVEHPVDFVDLEAFGHNNFEKELYDIDALIDQLKKESFADYLDFEQLMLVGHSKGGGTALAYTLQNKEVKKCTTLAAVINVVSRYGNVKDKKWKEEGVKYVMNGRTKQNMPLYYQFPENTQKLKSVLDIQTNLRIDKRRFLLVHGSADDAVLPRELELVNKMSHVEGFLIDGANHVFGGSHPYQESELPLDTLLALEKMVTFFQL